MKDYDWIEYEKILTGCRTGAARGATFRVSIVKSRNRERRPQAVFYIPEHICRSANFFIGERLNVRWTSDKKTASIYQSKNGYKLSLSGGVAKGESAKAFGSFGRASLKMSLCESLKEVFFGSSLEAYVPEIESISKGSIVFKISVD